MPADSPRVLVGVSGSIAAYKAVELVRRLVQAGARVQVAMTAGAGHFVTPLTFEAVSGRPVLDDPWARRAGEIEHVERAHEIDALVVAPASANCLARMAHGLADDAVTAVALATSAPTLVAPAMEHGMWNHPATQTNLRSLVSRGVEVIGPAHGALASGRSGDGRMEEPARIAAAVLARVGRARDLDGEHAVVTAGPTWEPIDPVRVLTNRSTGAMGIALAEAAARRGASVRLVLGPTHLQPMPVHGLEVTRVETAREMLDAARVGLDTRTIVVGAAAVGDFRPAKPSATKLKRRRAEAHVLPLEENPDVLATLAAELRSARADATVVGFAAETEDLEVHAREKLRRKGCDLVVGNLVGRGRGFGPEPTEVWIFDRSGGSRRLGPASKAVVAEAIWDAILVERRAR